MWNQETANQIDFTKIDFIVDAIDMVSSKILLIQWAKEKNIPIISCMGTGNRLNHFCLKSQILVKPLFVLWLKRCVMNLKKEIFITFPFYIQKKFRLVIF